MKNIENAQATQLTNRDGTINKWSITIDSKELYTLPAKFTTQDIFLIKDIINEMMGKATETTKIEAKALHDVTMNRIVSNGDMQLTMLKEENI